MAQKAYKQWYIEGLQALASANEVGEETTQKLMGCISSPELKEAVQQGAESSRRHAETIRDLLQQAGGETSGKRNRIMESIRDAADEIADSEDENIRDAGVIVSAQIALHYYMAAYGSLAATAKRLGMKEQAQTFARLNEEIKQADEAYTQMAEEDVNEKAQAA